VIVQTEATAEVTKMRARHAGLAGVVRVLVVLAIAAGAAGATASGGSGAPSGPRGLVAGKAKVTFSDYPSPGDQTTEETSVYASNGPLGPRGVIWFRSPLSSIPVARANVTCLTVDGGEARVGGRFSRPFTYAGSRMAQFLLVIQDTTPDLILPVLFRDAPRPPGFSPCGVNLPSVRFPVEAGGDYVVRVDSSG
jgi:hypothetical protein